MKTDFQTKFLQHLLNKKDNAGFTLIELLVVIIIIGILSAIALPSFLNQANKAKQSEAKTYIGSMNRAQQAYYLEKSRFVNGDVTNFSNLGLGVATATTNYQYKITKGGAAVTEVINHAITIVKDGATITVNPKASVKAYIGGVSIATVKGTGEASTLAVLCEGKSAPVNNGPTGEVSTIRFTVDSAPDCGDPASSIYEDVQG
jgi:type IV pilus assembly protein PilA